MERQDEAQFTYQNWWKNQFGSQLCPFVKFSFPVTRLMPYYAETDNSRPPNRLTLQITLFYRFS